MNKRRKTRQVKIGGLICGSDSPVLIQSMCSVRTEDIEAVVKQVKELEDEGCDLVRVAVPNFEAAGNLAEIRRRINMPLVADIHFDFRLALEAIKQGVDKIRINPGNIGGEARVVEVLEAAKKHGTAVRLGVNSGSLEHHLWKKYGRPSPEALVESALDWIKIFEKNDFNNFVVAIKSSDVPETVESYRRVAEKCDYPLHLGVTEAGLPAYGSVKSAVGIGALLLDGIGDTIRISLTADPVEEIRVAKSILKSLHLYNKEPEVIACPTCGRIEIDLIKMTREIDERLKKIKKPIKVTVLGCPVNGPGEAREADWGIAGGRGKGAIFRKGKVVKWVEEDKLVDEFMRMVEDEEA